MDGKPRRQSESVRKYITGMVQALNSFKPPERPGIGEVGGGKITNATLKDASSRTPHSLKNSRE